MKFIVAIGVLCTLAEMFSAKIPLRPEHPVFAGKRRAGARIVGGEEATPHSVPYQVGVFFDSYICGGSLINERYVLTAAYCATLSNQIYVVLGAHNLLGDEPEQVYMKGQAAIIHPGWNSKTKENDIALIELPQAVTLNKNIQTIPLAPEDAGDYAGETATATGWGIIDEGEDPNFNLRTVSTKIITNEQCQKELSAGIHVFDSVLCLDGSEHKTTCLGDFGGPLTVNGVQVGVSSYVVEGCELGYPSGYTRLSSYVDWIQQNSQID